MIERKGYKILIVDDEIEYQRVLSLIFSDLGYNVASCSNGLEAMEHLGDNFVDLVVTDIKMPVMDGLQLIKNIMGKNYSLDIIVLTAFGSIESAIDSIKLGAKDYFVKSNDLNELVMKVDRLAKIRRLERKSYVLLDNQNKTELFIESRNEEYLKLLEMCKRAAETGISILLYGESGVGKEVIANYIHRLSKRKEEPFVPINCQAFPEGVIESELFGHEKGAFTGAVDTRIGKFEQANLGTLFLDEIGDLPLQTQGKLLRAIESRRIERIGSNKSIDLDTRFISATNKDLSVEIRKGDFREDLLYRINTLTLEIPPLRERREDIPALIEFFTKKTATEQKKKIDKIDEGVQEYLLNYNYPGNIRELKNIIERMITLSKDGVVTVSDMLMPISSIEKKENEVKTLKRARENFENMFIMKALTRNNGNVTKTAGELEISTRQLWNKINQYKINLETMNKNS
ncbi:MAG: sigma-54 dependent transcriptional regulator [Tenericutes bacterium]|nr:sigma-54 dependent transcriptional regulator [Mycoplasmatota bacterium]